MSKKQLRNHRSLEEITAAYRAARSANIFVLGEILIEGEETHPGEWLAWVKDNEEDFGSVSSAERRRDAALLARRFVKLTNLNVGKTTVYALVAFDKKHPKLTETAITALEAAAKGKRLTANDAERIMEVVRLRAKFGDYPDATLVALDDIATTKRREPWHDKTTKALKAKKPEKEEEADAVILGVLQEHVAELYHAKLPAFDDQHAKSILENLARVPAEDRQRVYLGLGKAKEPVTEAKVCEILNPPPPAPASAPTGATAPAASSTTAPASTDAEQSAEARKPAEPPTPEARAERELVIKIRTDLYELRNAEARAAKHRLSAGQQMLALRKRIEAGGGNWWDYYKEKLLDFRSRKDAEEIMREAEDDESKCMHCDKSGADIEIATPCGGGALGRVHAECEKEWRDRNYMSKEAIERAIASNPRKKSKQESESAPEANGHAPEGRAESRDDRSEQSRDHTQVAPIFPDLPDSLKRAAEQGGPEGMSRITRPEGASRISAAEHKTLGPRFGAADGTAAAELDRQRIATGEPLKRAYPLKPTKH
jgi:hypothetical protein